MRVRRPMDLSLVRKRKKNIAHSSCGHLFWTILRAHREYTTNAEQQQQKQRQQLHLKKTILKFT